MRRSVLADTSRRSFVEFPARGAAPRASALWMQSVTRIRQRACHGGCICGGYDDGADQPPRRAGVAGSACPQRTSAGSLGPRPTVWAACVVACGTIAADGLPLLCLGAKCVPVAPAVNRHALPARAGRAGGQLRAAQKQTTPMYTAGQDAPGRGGGGYTPGLHCRRSASSSVRLRHFSPFLLRPAPRSGRRVRSRNMASLFLPGQVHSAPPRSGR